MSDIDDLAFDIRFAIKHGPIGRNTRKLVRALPDHDLGYLCSVIADHLRLGRGRRLPPDPPATTDQYPSMPKPEAKS
jgi:hypothetical protein